MSALKCPHCAAPVSANPIGRWFARFQCPHCAKVLRFDAKTNALGVAGSLCFLAGTVPFLMGDFPSRMTVVAVAAAGWIVLVGLSYALRGLEKG
jgi:hypothetical protein